MVRALKCCHKSDCSVPSSFQRDFSYIYPSHKLMREAGRIGYPCTDDIGNVSAISLLLNI